MTGEPKNRRYVLRAVIALLVLALVIAIILANRYRDTIAREVANRVLADSEVVDFREVERHVVLDEADPFVQTGQPFHILEGFALLTVVADPDNLEIGPGGFFQDRLDTHSGEFRLVLERNNDAD